MNRHRWMIFAKHGLIQLADEGGEGGGGASGQAPAASKPAEPAPAQETDWKAESRKWEARAKENSDAAARLAEIEEAKKSDDQKKDEALNAALAKVKEFEAREQSAAWAKEITEGSKIPADALRGSTREELEAHFNQLQSIMPADEPKKGAVGPYVAGEGGSPARQPQDTPTPPGRGTLRYAYQTGEGSS